MRLPSLAPMFLRLAGAAIAMGGAVLMARPLPLLAQIGIGAIVYVFFVWLMRILDEADRAALRMLVQRAWGRFFPATSGNPGSGQS
jgi:hypothetical protein